MISRNKFSYILLICLLVTFSCDNQLFDSEYKKDESRLFDKYYGLVDNTSLEKADRLKYIDSMIDFTRNKSKDTLMRNHLLDISISYGRLGVQDSSFKYKHKALKLSTKINDSVGLAKSNYSLGLYHLNNDALDSAYTYFYNSEKLYDQIDNVELGGTSALTMAITQKRVRDYVGAQESSVKAIELLEKTDEVRYLASAYNTLASVSRSLGKYESSIEYYTKVYDYRESLKKESLKKDDKLLNSSTLNNLGMVYMDMKEYPKAISNFKKGLSYDSLQIKKIKSYIRLIDNLAYAEYKNGNLESFPDLLLEALNKSREVNDRLAMVSSGMHLSEIYFEKGDTALSKYYAENAYKTAKDITYNDGILGSLELLMDASEPNDGITYGKEYIRISDSLQMEERAFQNKFARVRFETDKLEVAKNKATERSRILIIIFSISVIIFLTWVYPLAA